MNIMTPWASQIHETYYNVYKNKKLDTENKLLGKNTCLLLIIIVVAMKIVIHSNSESMTTKSWLQ